MTRQRNDILLLLPDASSLRIFDADSGRDGAVMAMQHTSFAVNEKGAEGAAVSKGDVIETALEIDPSRLYEITVDRPFIFYLTERSTQAWIVSGFIADFN